MFAAFTVPKIVDLVAKILIPIFVAGTVWGATQAAIKGKEDHSEFVADSLSRNYRDSLILRDMRDISGQVYDIRGQVRHLDAKQDTILKVLVRRTPNPAPAIHCKPEPAPMTGVVCQ